MSGWQAICVERVKRPHSTYPNETVEQEFWLLDPPTMQHGHDEYEWTMYRDESGQPIQGYFCSCRDRSKALWNLTNFTGASVRSAQSILEKLGYECLTT